MQPNPDTLIATEDLLITDSEAVAHYPLEQLINRVVLGDCLQVLQKLPAESVDMVFMDPPYFLQLPNRKLVRWNVKTAVEGVQDVWDRFESFEEYDHFLSTLLKELQRVMKPAATIWVIASYHSLFRIGKIMQDLGYWILNDVIWLKKNPMPNWLRVRFTNATETLIWAVKDKNAKGYAFHQTYARACGVGRIGANVWVIPICAGKERLRNGDGSRVHSTQKPAELLRRAILTTSREGDVILDPVAGVGTTGVVAHALGRRFIMVEVNPLYTAAIQERFRTPFKVSAAASVEREKDTRAYLKLDADASDEGTLP